MQPRIEILQAQAKGLVVSLTAATALASDKGPRTSWIRVVDDLYSRVRDGDVMEAVSRRANKFAGMPADVTIRGYI